MPQTPTLRRLMRESRELSPNPPAPILPNPTFHAAPLSDNLHEWHFTLLGPPSTSYAGGMYHGRIVLPPTYPLRPPSFRFLTPSGRFEVNREICLSISGFHEETWQPAWGVRLALTALRVFMTEDGKGQVGGLEASEPVRKELAERSRHWTCAGCETGGKTNEETMKEWWDLCRERGVQVGEDGEVVEGTGGQAEAIPEELRLGYRDELGKNNASEQEKKNEPSQGGNVEPAPRAETTEPTSEGSIGATTADGGQGAVSVEDPASSSAQSASSVVELPQTGGPNREPQTAPLRSSSSHSTSISQAQITQPQQTDLTRTAASPQSRPRNQTQPVPRPTQDLQNVSTPYLDKAISGVIIALLFMVLKKIFYV